jgi:SAM-dependent methyltransferase
VAVVAKTLDLDDIAWDKVVDQLASRGWVRLRRAVAPAPHSIGATSSARKVNFTAGRPAAPGATQPAPRPAAAQPDLRGALMTECPVDVGEALSRVESSIEDPGLRAYFELHRQRFLFTLELVRAAAVGTGSRVLDIGCFPGHLAMALECLGYQVTGVTSPGIPFERPNVHLVDIEKEPLPFSNESFDLVVFVETIEHLPHSPVFPLREMLRIAKPGAAIIVTTPNLVCGSNRLRFIRGRSPLFPLESYFEEKGHGGALEHRHNREYTMDELDRILSECGWRVEQRGFFVAYSKWMGDRSSWSAAKKAREAVKYGPEVLVRSSRDSLYAVGRKPISL